MCTWKWVKTAVSLATVGIWPAMGADSVDVAALARLVEQQSRQIEQQGQQIAELTTRLKQLEAAAGDSKQAKQELPAPKAALADSRNRGDDKLQFGTGIDGLKLTGDLRVRYETRDRHVENFKTNSDSDRTRLRERFRLGGVWTNKEEKWEVGAGVATGNGRTGGLTQTTSDGRGTDADWGRTSAFDHQELWLDYAYARHRWEYERVPVSLTAGQQKSPFVNTLLTWDPDLRPQGLSLQYGDPQAKGYTGLFVTAGAYELYYLSDGTVTGGDKQNNLEDNVFWFATQAGYKAADWLAMAGYQKVTDAYRNVAANYGASQVPNNPVGGADTGYGYDIFEAYGEYKFRLGTSELRPYAHIAYNVSADGAKSQARTTATPETENLGWLVGADFKRGPWSMGYGYAYVGADSVFGPLRDNTFGDTAGLTDTDLQGHFLRLSYDWTKNVNVGAVYYWLERIDGGSTRIVNEADKAQLLQIEATYKF